MQRNQPPPKEKKEKIKLVAPEPVEIADDATTAQAVTAFNKYQAEYAKYTQALLAEQKIELTNQQRNSVVKQRQDQVQKFLSTAEHANNPDVFKRMETMYNGGQDIESAYKDAVKLAGIKTDANKDDKGNKEETLEKRTTLTNNESASSGDVEVTEKKPESTKDIISRNLDKAIEETDGAEDLFKE